MYMNKLLYSTMPIMTYTVSKKRYHPTTNNNFNSSCSIPVIFGTNIPERICYQKVVYFPTSPASYMHLTFRNLGT